MLVGVGFVLDSAGFAVIMLTELALTLHFVRYEYLVKVLCVCVCRLEEYEELIRTYELNQEQMTKDSEAKLKSVTVS